MKKPGPYFSPLTTLALAFPEEMAMAMDMAMPKEKEYAPPKKCLLAGCDKMREGNKLFCCREHFGEYQKMKKGKA
jgi:hypothetical protein